MTGSKIELIGASGKLTFSSSAGQIHVARPQSGKRMDHELFASHGLA